MAFWSIYPDEISIFLPRNHHSARKKAPGKFRVSVKLGHRKAVSALTTLGNQDQAVSLGNTDTAKRTEVPVFEKGSFIGCSCVSAGSKYLSFLITIEVKEVPGDSRILLPPHGGLLNNGLP